MSPLCFGCTLCVAAMMLGPSLACGQSYQTKPIRVVTSAAGGGGDFAARIVANGISPGLEQNVIVENRAAGGQSAEIVANAAPDGSTLLMVGQSFWIGPLIDKVVYDPVQAFSPITLVNRQPQVLVVNPKVPVYSVKELIALAKAKPGVLNYSTGSTGTSTHLAGELFKSMAGINLVRVQYRTIPLRMLALLTGDEVQVEFSATTNVMSLVKEGRLRALAVTSAQPSPVVPGLPTVAATGLPGYESSSTYAMFAPAKTPAAIIKRLNEETRRVLAREDVKQKFFSLGIEATGSTPKELADYMKAETARMSKVVKNANIRAE